MNILNEILAVQLTEREIIIFQLIESGMTPRDLAIRLGNTSYETIRGIHKRAKKKVLAIEKSGLLDAAERS